MLAKGSASFERNGSGPPGVDRDRRAAPRIQTVYFFVKVTREADAGLFRVRNISDEGMMLCSHVPFKIGECVLVELTPTLAVEGTVTWCEDACCGVRFDQPIDCAAMLHLRAEQKLDPRGPALRLPVSRLATCYAETGIRAVKITDISRRGVGLAHDGSIKTGRAIKLVLESGTAREGTVCWSRNGQAGVRLAQPLTWGELESTRGFDPMARVETRTEAGAGRALGDSATRC